MKKRYKIHGIGIDIVSVKRMTEIINRHGDRFAQKVLTNQEFLKYNDSPNKAQYLAKCWAVKEAFVKALGTGFTKGLSWKDISYFSPTGNFRMTNHPTVYIGSSNDFRHPMMDNKLVHLSVSDEKDYAVANVTIESEYNE